jgi:hypothetical protein
MVMASKENRTWRTNIGLRLTPEMGAALEWKCQEENRTFANYIETLIIRDLEKKPHT